MLLCSQIHTEQHMGLQGPQEVRLLTKPKWYLWGGGLKLYRDTLQEQGSGETSAVWNCPLMPSSLFPFLILSQL